MERLTEEKQIGPFAALKDKAEAVPGAFGSYDCLYAHMVAVTRLKEYEDTGIEPEEVKEHEAAYIEIMTRTYGPIHEKIGQWLQAEKDGRLVVLPCRVGDLLYEIDLPEYGVITCKALEVHAYIGPDMHVQGAPMVSAVSVSVEVIDGHGKGSGYTFEILDFGKTVFLSREEAEAALRKGEEDNEAD